MGSICGKNSIHLWKSRGKDFCCSLKSVFSFTARTPKFQEAYECQSVRYISQHSPQVDIGMLSNSGQWDMNRGDFYLLRIVDPKKKTCAPSALPLPVVQEMSSFEKEKTVIEVAEPPSGTDLINSGQFHDRIILLSYSSYGILGLLCYKSLSCTLIFVFHYTNV